MLRVHVMGTGVALLALGLACAGVGGAGSSGGASSEQPLTVGVQGQDAPATTQQAPKTLSFGKPQGWTQDKETYDSDGHKVIHYVLSGPAASVQLILHPPGAAPPDPQQEIAGFKQALQQELGDDVLFGEPETRTRELSGQQVQGQVVHMSLSLDGETVQAQHVDYLVRGPRTSCLVVVDVPDVSDPAQMSAVDEVLARLQVP